jgi:iron-sulfur cluster assembly protein
MQQQNLVQITEKAAEEVRKALAIKGIPEGYQLRIGLRGSACSATFLVGFDQKEPLDEIFDIAGLSVLINKHHLLYLAGVTLDYEEAGNGFVFLK